MAHELKDNDGLILADRTAWHGLGTVVQGAPNPFAALRLAKMEWEVLESETIAGSFTCGDEVFNVSTDASKMLVRSDDMSVLGVVGQDYQPIQNATLAVFAYAFRKAGEEAGVQVESAGSIRGGRKVWMLLRAPSVDMTGMGDEAVPYLMLGNSHDGTMALRILPTSIRVVCSNTFHAALGRENVGWSLRHTLNIAGKVDALVQDIRRWQREIDTGRQVATQLAARQVNRKAVQDLWADVLTRLDGKIPTDPANGWEARKVEHATQFLAHAAQVFDREAQQHGANLWVAVNAATNAIQHVRSEWAIRTKDGQQRAYAAWDGTTATATAKAFDVAMSAL